LTLTKRFVKLKHLSTNGADHPSRIKWCLLRQWWKWSARRSAVNASGVLGKIKAGSAIAHEKRLYALVLFKWIYSHNRAALAALYYRCTTCSGLSISSQKLVRKIVCLAAKARSKATRLRWPHSIAKLDEIQSQLGRTNCGRECPAVPVRVHRYLIFLFSFACLFFG